MYTHNESLRRYSLLMWLLTLFLVPVVRAQEDGPHFGSGLVLIPNQAVISPQGNYAASIQKSQDNVLISLWDIRQLAADGKPTVADNVEHMTLPYRQGPESISLELIAFSYDEHYLAVRKDYDITLLTLPELSVYETMAVPAKSSILWGEIGWASDENLLAVELDTSQLLVWNVDANEKYYNRITCQGPIAGIRNGWLLRYYCDYPYEWAFMTCSRLAEFCTSYAWEDIPVSEGEPIRFIASPEGETVLTMWSSENHDATWAWRRQPDGSYQLDSEPLTVLSSQSPQLFSQDGRYLVTTHSTYEIIQKATSRVVEWQSFNNIWDFQTLDLLQTLENNDACSLAFFFNNSNYFVAYCGYSALLKLYQIGSDAPLDMIELNGNFGFDAPDVLEGLIEPSPVEIDISQNGQWALVNYGRGKLLVPIILSG